MRTPSMKDILDRAVIDAITLAWQNYAHIERCRDGVPVHLAPPTKQPGQWEDGELRKVARMHLAGTDCFVDVKEVEAGDDGVPATGWAVKIVDKEGTVLYECGPGGFDLAVAAALVTSPSDPDLEPDPKMDVERKRVERKIGG